MKLKEKMKNNNHKKFDKKKLIGTISKKHIKNGSYTMVMSVIFIAVVVVLNMIVNAIPSKYSEIDISSQKLYSIGDDTKAMLKDLDKDVTIYQIAQSGSEDENITNLLKKYEDESKHIKVEQLHLYQPDQQIYREKFCIYKCHCHWQDCDHCHS